MGERILKEYRLYQELIQKYQYLIDKVSKEITIKDPISNKKVRFIFEGFKKGEPLLVVRIPNTRFFKTYHIDYLVMEK